MKSALTLGTRKRLATWLRKQADRLSPLPPPKKKKEPPQEEISREKSKLVGRLEYSPPSRCPSLLNIYQTEGGLIFALDYGWAMGINSIEPTPNHLVFLPKFDPDLLKQESELITKLLRHEPTFTDYIEKSI